jgi:hypothetical protein
MPQKSKKISMFRLNAEAKEHLLDVCKYGYGFSSESHQGSKKTVNRFSQQSVIQLKAIELS